MSSSTTGDQTKPVTGYPAQSNHVATGYPQAAPPPPNSAYHFSTPPPPPTAFYTATAGRYQHHSDRRASSFLGRLLAAGLLVFLVMSLVFFIVWLVLRPRLPEFRVSSATSSPLNATDSELTATWDFSLQITNPNRKLSVLYDRIEASVIYGDDFLLSQTALPPFSQPKNNQTSIHYRLAVVGANVGEDVARAISGDQSHGSVRFGIRVLGLVRFRSSGWNTRRHLMRVYCEGVSIGYSTSHGGGTLLNPLNECDVDL